MQYIPIYTFRKILPISISQQYKYINWDGAPESAKKFLTIEGKESPIVVEIEDDYVQEYINKDLYVYSIIFQDPFYIFQYASEKTHNAFSTSYVSGLQNPSQLIKKDKMEEFLSIAIPEGHKDDVHRILGYYYEMLFRTSAIEIKIITEMSIIEHILHNYNPITKTPDEKEVLGKIKNSIQEILVQIGITKNKKEAKQTHYYSQILENLSKSEQTPLTDKIIMKCKELGLNVDENSISNMKKLRNDWIHGNEFDYSLAYSVYPQLDLIVKMLIINLLTGKRRDYQSFMEPFSERYRIVTWDKFF